jgi:hypothetical protein
MVLGGISQFFPPSMSSVIVGAYVIVFGLGKSRDPAHDGQVLTLIQLLAAWSSCPTFPTTPTATPPSCSLSWAVVSVRDRIFVNCLFDADLC